ncbi:MAG: DMT family transporter [Chloroflexi bacterium]|jgi:drug/metabolite transporter (DMT)-like permease|nr:DMT family transporter [Chloroflexota bacterium]
MTLANLLILVGSAFVHVVTHIALKRSRDRTAFVWWMLLFSGVLFVPVVIFAWQPIPWQGWALLIGSAVFEAAYFYAIARAYRGADLSVVYPLSRGLGPTLLLVWSVLLLREPLTWGGALGVLTIVVGLYVVNLPRLGAWKEPFRALRLPSSRWALAAGVCISLYTMIDKVGIGYVEPLLYTYLALWWSVVMLTPFTLHEIGWGGLRNEWHYSKGWTVLAGFTSLCAYAMVLFAMARGTTAAYAGAIREFSVVLGAAYGVLVLKESSGPMRLLGAALVAAGIATIGLIG